MVVVFLKKDFISRKDLVVITVVANIRSSRRGLLALNAVASIRKNNTK